MRVKSTLIAISLLSLSLPAHAQDGRKADPFRPAQPAWPAEWSQGYEAPKPKAAPKPEAAPAPDPEAGETAVALATTPPPKQKSAKKRAKPAREPAPQPAVMASVSSKQPDNEYFLFDEQGNRVGTDAVPAPAPAPAPVPQAQDDELPPSVAATKASEPAPAPAPSQGPPPDVDLHKAHVWMATGAVLLGVGIAAGLAAGIGNDDPKLMALSFAAGGVLGLAGVTIGVVSQNQRYREAGYQPKPALPSGIQLNVTVPLP